MDQPEKLPELTIIHPDSEEAAAGLAQLQLCIPHWKDNAALLIVKPDLAVIVSVADYAADDDGFTLRLAVEEKLLAAPDFQFEHYNVACGWNQPYLSYGPNGISAPYSFSLHVGTDGVARAREVTRLLMAQPGLPDDIPWDFTLLRWCFGANGERHLAELKAQMQKPKDQ